ncbi:MAG TPA: methionyl-tRNA formyltransferase [Bacteroidales bacterium]|jgi:methionyl-tRNA formyltransferase|nr:methionyl-tRNA formyltransferase [Bacteroidales bacterium]MBP8709896.1 methionyl-tRNA formyltransferase [Bacteroidales bacterium]MZQ78858.1 methionyl-tRNA formyltransferase [Bacteroidales bacterium]HHU98323.1 methionyl-tRNA formyltransferase [Bacteroidales bacterium]HNV66233.1 methionyl-tRNA formyltransferase [Bacteroidales bacterium]
MTEPTLRIVFMGTPEFAVASLNALYETGVDIAAVVTAPDRPCGRGRKITFSPVKKYAMDHRLTLFQPEKLRDPEFISALRDINADLFVVVAFRMLPEEVWSMPRLGTFNLHASLLPQYRGAAPINHAIINGETMTGVTTFLIDEDIDTGMILLSRETAILPDETAGSLHDRLMETGARLVVETARGLAAGSLKPAPQEKMDDTMLKPAPKISPADMVIRWEKIAENIHNLIRGLSPCPGANTMLRKEGRSLRLKILDSTINYEITGNIPGTLIVTEKSRLMVACGKDTLEILSLIPEGRKRMSAAEFLRGFDLSGWEMA